MDPLLTVVSTAVPAGWDDLVAADTTQLPAHELHQSTSWLRARGSFATEPVEPVVCHRGEHLLGGLVTRRVEPREPQWRLALDEALPPEHLPARLVGGLYDGRSTPVVAPGSTVEVSGALLDRAEALAAARGERSVVLRTVDAGAVDLLALLRDRGYAAHAAETHFVLPVAPSWEAYVAGLRPSYRSSVRRDRRKLREAGVEVALEALDRTLVAELAPLAVQLSSKYAAPGEAAHARTELQLERRSFGGDMHVLVARRQGRPLGFVTVFEHRGHAWAWQAGFDYEAQGDLPVYFELCYYAMTELAIERGWGSVDQTIGAGPAKLSRGCVARPTLRLVKPVP